MPGGTFSVTVAGVPEARSAKPEEAGVGHELLDALGGGGGVLAELIAHAGDELLHGDPGLEP